MAATQERDKNGFTVKNVFRTDEPNQKFQYAQCVDHFKSLNFLVCVILVFFF